MVAEAAPIPIPGPNRDMIAAFCEHLMHPAEVYEVRIPQARRGPARLFGTVAGYFDNAAEVAKALARIGGADAAGVYITLNPVKPALLARGRNKLVNSVKATAADADIVRRRLLLIDTDPRRDPADVSASDAELDGALARRDAVRQYLHEMEGWPDALVVSESGNGGALLYAIDLPNDAAAATLVQRALAGLDANFSDGRVKVDAVNYNAARITKVVGTVAAKGEHFVDCPGQPDRPWRLATAQYPDHPGVVTAQQLGKVASHAPTARDARPSDAPADGPLAGRTWTMDQLLAANNLSATPRPWLGAGEKYPLDRCLASADHTAGAALFEMPSGAVVYRCLHDRCADKDWRYLREHSLITIPGTPADRGLNGRRSSGDTAHTAHTAQGRTSTQAGDTAHTAHTAQGRSAPPVLDAAALYGVAGDAVRAISAETEAHEAALLLTLLVYFGNLIHSAPHTLVTSKRHGTNLFAVLVGRTSGSRKGTSRAEIDALFGHIDADWRDTRVKMGLSTGEGLISEVRDAVRKHDGEGTAIVVDEGVTDKRLVVVEEEFCAPIKLMAREGNNLSAVVRQAWDGHNLGTLTRHNPMTATRPHISLLGHTTQPELLKYLTDTEMADGFANRFLWVSVERSKLLPHGGGQVDYGTCIKGLCDAVRFARGCSARPIVRDAAANALWERVYPHLTAERGGMFGAVTSRAEAQALRLSMVYALLDQSAVVRLEHLAAALAVWDFCQESARLIFGQATGDEVADRILAALRNAGSNGVDLEDMRELFSRHLKPARRDAALGRLVEAGLAYGVTEETDGRPRTVYRAGKADGAR